MWLTERDNALPDLVLWSRHCLLWNDVGQGIVRSGVVWCDSLCQISSGLAGQTLSGQQWSHETNTVRSTMVSWDRYCPVRGGLVGQILPGQRWSRWTIDRMHGMIKGNAVYYFFLRNCLSSELRVGFCQYSRAFLLWALLIMAFSRAARSLEVAPRWHCA